jgi:phenylacetate-CoA ligase
MPLIRYRTGDYATKLSSSCGCGRVWDRFGDVDGRWKQDMVFGRSGAKISIAALNMHGTMFANVIRYQYYQEELGKCDIKVMVSPMFTEKERFNLEVAFNKKVGNEVSFNVKIVNDIPLTSQGKLRFLESKLKKI